jgi:hypothetical protein
VLVAVAVAVAVTVAVLVAVDVAVAVVAPVEVEPELELVDDEVLEPLELEVEEEVLEPLELEVEEEVLEPLELEVLDELDEGAAGDEDLENAPPRAARATADNPTAAQGPTAAADVPDPAPAELDFALSVASEKANTLVEVIIAAEATLTANTTAIDFFKFITHFLWKRNTS